MSININELNTKNRIAILNPQNIEALIQEIDLPNINSDKEKLQDSFNKERQFVSDLNKSLESFNAMIDELRQKLIEQPIEILPTKFANKKRSDVTGPYGVSLRQMREFLPKVMAVYDVDLELMQILTFSINSYE